MCGCGAVHVVRARMLNLTLTTRAPVSCLSIWRAPKKHSRLTYRSLRLHARVVLHLRRPARGG
jgi:hypothetical protein